jgi:hypothetical protein
MQSLRTGLAFCGQAWRAVRHAPGYFWPSILGILAGIIITLLALIPIGLVVAILGKDIPSVLLIGILCALLLGVQFACGELSALVTADQFHRHFVQTEGETQKAKSLLSRAGLDWLIFRAAFPFVAVQRWQRQRQSTGVKSEEAWLEATYLVMPLMVIEKLNLKDSLRRAAQMVNEHTLLGKENIIGVKVVNRLVYAVSVVMVVLVSMVIFRLFHGAAEACLATFFASLFSLTAIFLAAFNRATYHTCLYSGTQVNEAALQGKPGGETWAREMLATVLNRTVH